jgi:hypothetical protein
MLSMSSSFFWKESCVIAAAAAGGGCRRLSRSSWVPCSSCTSASLQREAPSHASGACSKVRQLHAVFVGGHPCAFTAVTPVATAGSSGSHMTATQAVKQAQAFNRACFTQQFSKLRSYVRHPYGLTLQQWQLVCSVNCCGFVAEQVRWSTGSSRCLSPTSCTSLLRVLLTITSSLRWDTPTA